MKIRSTNNYPVTINHSTKKNGVKKAEIKNNTSTLSIIYLPIASFFKMVLGVPLEEMEIYPRTQSIQQ